jgi:hypothetical protein
MTYVWLDTTTGMRRFVNDIYLSSCNHCGKTVSECRKADCYKNPYEMTPYLPTNMTKENEDEQPIA